MKPVHMVQVSLDNAEAENYRPEIAMLHKKLHEREQENKYLREVCEMRRKRKKTCENWSLSYRRTERNRLLFASMCTDRN